MDELLALFGINPYLENHLDGDNMKPERIDFLNRLRKSFF